MKKHSFSFCLAVYAGVLLLIAALGLGFLWMYLDAYEHSLPAGTLAAYEEERLHQEYRTALDEYAADHSSALESREQIVQALSNLLDETTLRLKRDSSGTDMDYVMRISGQNVGTLHLTVDGKQRFGFGTCRIAEAQWAFPETLATTYRITAPQRAEVLANGVVLTKEVCAAKAVPLEIDLTEGLPTVYQREYTLTCFEQPELTVQSDGDVVYTLTQSGNSAWTVEGEYAEEAAAQYRSFAESFLKLYVSFSAGKTNVRKIMPYLVEDTALAKLVQGANNTMKYVHTGNFKIQNLGFDSIRPCGDAIVCQAHYTVSDDLRHTDVDTSVDLLLISQDGKLKVQNLILY